MAWSPDYAETDELAEFMRIADNDDDVQLAAAIAAASRAIDDFTKRQFGTVDEAEARYYTPRWSRSRGAWLVQIDDLTSTDELVIALDLDGDDAHEHALAGGWVLQPRNAAADGMPWTELLIRPAADLAALRAVAGAVEITSPGWGWVAGVPAAVHEACLLQSSRIAARRDSPFGVAGSPETGSELRLLDRVDPDVAVTLSRYRRRAWVR